MARGGARPGAGRPKKAEKTRRVGPVVSAENKLRDRLPELVDVALRLALDEDSERMLIYCIDRVLGKATQPIDLEVSRAAARLAAAIGADPEFLIRRAQQLAAENSEAVAQ